MNLSDDFRFTPLITAAGFNNRESVTLLINAGADVNSRTVHGETALARAAYFGHEKCVKALIEAGANVNARNKRKETPLICALKKSRFRCVEELLQAGADVNITTSNGDTALVIGITKRSSKYEKLLIQAGADVNIPYKDEQTLLADACVSGDADRVHFLLKHGAFVNIQYKSGIKPLSDLIKDQTYQKEEIQRLLLAAGEFLDHDTLRSRTFQQITSHFEIPDYDIDISEQDLCLKLFCRKVIRTFLMERGTHLNLFVRVPLLPLPTTLKDLLFDVSLDT